MEDAVSEALSTVSLSPLTSIPRPVVDIITDYAKEPPWKLAPGISDTSGPSSAAALPISLSPHHAAGVSGEIERTSDYSARHTGDLEAFIQGDTPFASGQHRWRVTVRGLAAKGGDMFLGIVQAGKALSGKRSMKDPTFFGIWTLDGARGFSEGRYSGPTGFAEIRSGDGLEFLLDLDASPGSLTVTTLKDGKRHVFSPLPQGLEWVPHFHFSCRGNAVEVEVLPADAQESGKEGNS